MKNLTYKKIKKQNKNKKSMSRHIIIKLLRTRKQSEKNEILVAGEKLFK